MMIKMLLHIRQLRWLTQLCILNLTNLPSGLHLIMIHRLALLPIRIILVGPIAQYNHILRRWLLPPMA